MKSIPSTPLKRLLVMMLVCSLASACTMSLVKKEPEPVLTSLPDDFSDDTQPAEPELESALTDMLGEQQQQLMQQQSQINAISKGQETLLTEIEDLSRQTINITKALNLPLSVDEPQANTRALKSKSAASSKKTVIGRNEWVYLPVLNQNLRARVDTGARTSSINASEISLFERDGEKWVSFKIPNDKQGRTFERPLARYSKILQASEEKREKRPVVKLKIRMGDHMQETEVTLANREKMLFPVLLGRRYINDLFLVDSSRKSTQKAYPIDSSAQ